MSTLARPAVSRPDHCPGRPRSDLDIDGRYLDYDVVQARYSGHIRKSSRFAGMVTVHTFAAATRRSRLPALSKMVHHRGGVSQQRKRSHDAGPALAGAPGHKIPGSGAYHGGVLP
jgi:hypothetical protein